MVGRRDRRIWTPDETCEPFTIECNRSSANIPLLGFTVARGLVAVIASIVCGTEAPAPNSKEVSVVRLGKGNFDIATGSTVAIVDVPIHGALSEVVEPGLGGGIQSVPGFITTSGVFPRPTRIVLPGGQAYVLYKPGTIPGGSVASVVAIWASLHGWTFPDAPK